MYVSIYIYVRGLLTKMTNCFEHVLSSYVVYVTFYVYIFIYYINMDN